MNSGGRFELSDFVTRLRFKMGKVFGVLSGVFLDEIRGSFDIIGHFEQQQVFDVHGVVLI